MKKAVAAMLAISLLFSGCGISASAPDAVPTPPPVVELPTDPTPSADPTESTEPPAGSTEPPTEATEPPTGSMEPPTSTAPDHSPLFIEGLSADALILYFEEICLDAEVINSGDPTRLQKWEIPIVYRILGDPTPEDLETVDRFTQWFNTVEGSPGIRMAEPEETGNMDIYFCTQEEMTGLLGDWTLGCDGGVTFWYDMDRIYSATVCVRTDLNQAVRNSVILEEIYNGLGPVQDTDLRTDSIIWSGFSAPQWMTAEDMLILQLLYHPTLEPGMDRDACAEAIRALYY